MKSIILHLVNVYEKDIIIGYGYWTADKRGNIQSVLIGLDGNELPPSWYVLHNVEDRLAVVPERKQ